MSLHELKKVEVMIVVIQFGLITEVVIEIDELVK